MADDPETPNTLIASARSRSVARGDVPEVLRRRYYTDDRGGAGLGFYADATVQRPAFRDEGRRLVAARADPSAIRDMTAIAQHRGWTIVTARGSAESGVKLGSRAAPWASRFAATARPSAMCRSLIGGSTVGWPQGNARGETGRMSLFGAIHPSVIGMIPEPGRGCVWSNRWSEAGSRILRLEIASWPPLATGSPTGWNVGRDSCR